MRRIVVAVSAAAALLGADAASAATRLFVKSTGSDAGACTLAAPCRSLDHAVAVVDAGGEVVVLDSAGYGGGFTISQSVTVSAPPGVHALVTVTGALGIVVAAGPADTVTLQGLTLRGPGAGSQGVGIRLQSNGTRLRVDRCELSGFDSAGIQILGSGGVASVLDTVVRDSNTGLEIDGSGRVGVERSRFENNRSSALIAWGGRIAVQDTVATGHGFSGFIAAGSAQVNLRRVEASNNGSMGIWCNEEGATVRVADALVTNNGVGVQSRAGCTFESLGNNLVGGNGQDVVGEITVVAGR
jgi:hypothetical protein